MYLGRRLEAAVIDGGICCVHSPLFLVMPTLPPTDTARATANHSTVGLWLYRQTSIDIHLAVLPLSSHYI
jgi:hypothetical protein